MGTSCHFHPRRDAPFSASEAPFFASDAFFFVSVAAIVLATRLPFLGPGYGLDPDGWRVATAAEEIAATGSYAPSRPPGFPVHELASALLHRGGPLALNLATAVASACAAGFLGLALRGHGVRGAFAASLAFALTPVVYVESSTSMDYLWTTALALAAACAVGRGRPVLAGVALGLAAGCRATTLALAPALLLFAPTRRARVVFAVTSAVVAVVCYVPVVAGSGLGPLDWVAAQRERFEDFANPGLRVVFEQATLGVWGSVGAAGLVLAAVGVALRGRAAADPLRRPLVLASLVAGTTVVALYLLLAHEPGYLIPAVPFAIALLATLLERRVFLAVAALLAVAPWVEVGAGGPRPGRVLAAHEARVLDVARVEALAHAAEILEGPCVLLAGADQAKLAETLGREGRRSIEVIGFAHDAARLERLRERGSEMWTLPGVEEENRRRFGVDPAAFGARPLPDRAPAPGSE